MKSPAEVLKEYWGYDEFRSLQPEIIQSILSGHDTLALLPTGGGKSICFQVPALCQEGICIVISPLIALMKDQVYNLKRRGISSAAIYSGMSYREIDLLLDNCIYGDVKLLYLSPERLQSELARERIKKMNISFIAVDEAHCISQWGYDFRPPYLQIPEIRDLIGDVPVLALTATATPEVVKDIQDKLQFRKGHVFQKSFARPNLAYVVRYVEGKEHKLIEILQKVKGSGVVYVRNRKRSREIAALLSQRGISADYYHAGLDSDQRSKKQEDWMAGKSRIMVSTNAFGMGIDKPDVRIVVHMELPDSLEAYFQEAGRAGRDGKKAFAVLLYNAADRFNLEQGFEKSFPPLQQVRQVYQALGSYLQLATGSGPGESYDFDIGRFCEIYKIPVFQTMSCLKMLEQSGWIALTEAIWTPSSVMVIANREQLYDYMLRFPSFDQILKSVLRAYQGVFNQFVSIKEEQIAKALNMATDEVIRALTMMSKENIILYNPRKDKPQIIFIKERVDSKNLDLDTDLYQFRKQRQLFSIQNAIAYAESHQCRSQQLLAYFGETNAALCGQCDVCLDKTPQQLRPEDFELIKQEIRDMLIQQPQRLMQLSVHFSGLRKQQYEYVLGYLLEEGFVSERQGLLSWQAKL
jgi:ATP-dependent DNA helicase RecQ